MEQLPITFKGKGEVSGILFTQLFRFKDLCLYERSDRCWEIVKARQQKAASYVIAGRQISHEEREAYPTKEAWGLYEWCCGTLEKAIERYNEQAKAMEYNIVLKESMLVYPQKAEIKEEEK